MAVFSIQDAKSILALQKLAYASEAEIYDDFDIDPLTQAPDALHRDLRNHVFLKASMSGRILGSVRGYLDRTGISIL
jgi:hypothetical protein